MGRPKKPVHPQVMYLPDGRVEGHVVVPMAKWKGTHDCKYCYRTHRSWWLMDQLDYQFEDMTIILCAYCEHTSAIDDPATNWTGPCVWPLPERKWGPKPLVTLSGAQCERQ